MSTVRFRCEEKFLSRILWKGTHESLQCFPKTGSRNWRGIRGERQVWIRVRSTRPVCRIVWAVVVGESNPFFAGSIYVTRSWNGVRKSNLGWLINEEHVGNIGPGIGVRVGRSVFAHPARSIFLEQPNHGRTSRSAIDPDCERSGRRIFISCFKEPPENVLILGHVGVSRVAFHIGVLLTDSGGNLLVTYTDICISFSAAEIVRCLNELRGTENRELCGSYEGLDVSREAKSGQPPI